MQIINGQESHDEWVMGVNGFGLCGHGRSNGHKKLKFLKSEFSRQNRKIDFSAKILILSFFLSKP